MTNSEMTQYSTDEEDGVWAKKIWLLQCKTKPQIFNLTLLALSKMPVLYKRSD